MYEFKLDLQKHFLDGYKSFAIFYGKRAIIDFGENFAPGVWAGTEGFKLEHNNEFWQIVKVDYDLRILECIKVKNEHNNNH